MSTKQKRKKKVPAKIAKEQVGGPNFYGNPTFGGTGNWGKGGYRQLASFDLNPATQELQDKEQEEIGQNISDQQASLGKYKLGSTITADEPVAHWDGRNGATDTVAEQSIAEQAPYDNSVSRMRDLPGFPKMNTLVNPQAFVPANDHSRNVDPATGGRANYLGPTLDGEPIEDDDYIPGGDLPGQQQNVVRDDKTDKKIDDLLGDFTPETEKGRDPNETSDLILHQFVEDTINEILGCPKATYPSRQGWKNTQINSLVWRKNQIDPQQEPMEMWHRVFTDPADHNPRLNNPPAPQKTAGFGYSAIGWPKQFVPQDYEQANPDYDDIIKDPIGTRRLGIPVDKGDPVIGVNASISEGPKSEGGVRKLTLEELKTIVRTAASEEASEDDLFGKFLFAPQRADVPKPPEKNTEKETMFWNRLQSHYSNGDTSFAGSVSELLQLVQQGKYKEFLEPPAKPAYRFLNNLTLDMASKLLGIPAEEIEKSPNQAWYSEKGGILHPHHKDAQSWTTQLHSSWALNLFDPIRNDRVSVVLVANPRDPSNKFVLNPETILNKIGGLPKIAYREYETISSGDVKFYGAAYIYCDEADLEQQVNKLGPKPERPLRGPAPEYEAWLAKVRKITASGRLPASVAFKKLVKAMGLKTRKPPTPKAARKYKKSEY